MTERKVLSDRAVRTLQAAGLVTGLVSITVSIGAKVAGLSIGRSFTSNQLLMLGVGLVLILAGVVGRRVVTLYKGLAMLLLNAVVFISFMELFSLAVLKIWRPDELIRSENRERTGAVAQETQLHWGAYQPYTVWKADTSLYFQEPIGADGFRLTPGSMASDSSYLVYVLGGSTVWGVGSPDSCTIPARMLSELASRTDRPIDVRNLGQLGWVSTQELLELVLRIRGGDRPDLVVFLDGMNDVSAAYQSGIAGVHQNFPEIAARMEGRIWNPALSESPLLTILSRTNSYILAAQLITTLSPPPCSVDLRLMS